ncbi:MAG: PKD domain-containing protein [Thermoplasmatota archaeon]
MTLLAVATLVLSTVAVTADNGGPSADFTWEPQEPTDLQDVQFTYTGSGDAIVWMWDFGDGSTATNKNPVHRYDENGTYTVRLTVWDDQNHMDTTTRQVNVSNVPPVADAGGDIVTDTLTIRFNASDSYDPDGTIQSYAWDFGDGDDGTGITRNHTYAEAGNYTVELNVTDNDGASNTTTLELLIDATAPVTNATFNGTATGDWYRSNVTVTLNATDNESGVNATWYMLTELVNQTWQNGTWQQYNASFDVTGEGRYNLTYYSVDTAGNREENNTAAVNIDVTPPVTNVTLNGTLGKQGWYRGAVTATLNATDTLSGTAEIEYAVDNGGDWETYDGAVTISGTGTHTLQYRATDAAGNREAIHNLTIHIDGTSPSASLDTPQPGSIYLFGRDLLPTLFGNTVIIGDLTASVTATDTHSGVYKVFFYLDGELLWEDYNAPYQVTLPNEFPLARHDISAVAYDAAGNTRATQTVQYLKML